MLQLELVVGYSAGHIDFACFQVQEMYSLLQQSYQRCCCEERNERSVQMIDFVG